MNTVHKYHLNYAEFYITNVCNYNCSNCNRFNNYHFDGQQLWKNYADIYKEWSQKIALGTICILGGEPLLNPSVIEWIDGIATLWPNTEIQLITNGSRITHVDKLYKTIKKYKGRVHIFAYLHNINNKDMFIDSMINEFLKGNVSKTSTAIDDALWSDQYNDVKDSSWEECNTPADFKKLPKRIQKECIDVFGFSDEIFITRYAEVVLTDVNNVSITVSVSDYFNENAITLKNNKFVIHDSNPRDAIDVCYSKTCHHFSKGRLNKCAVVDLLPEFYKQFNFDISDNDYNLMHAYVPLLVTDSDVDTTAFLDNLKSNSVIPQCKFCPTKLDGHLLNATAGNKPKVTKKHR
jgi:organic radical activating enzyme